MVKGPGENTESTSIVTILCTHTFWWVSAVLAVLAWPVNGHAAIHLEALNQAPLSDVPGNAPQEHPGRVGGVLVPACRQLPTPGAHHICGGRRREGRKGGRREGGKGGGEREGEEGREGRGEGGKRG